MSVPLTNSSAQEMARHGYVRRLKVLKHCVNTVFSRLPPWSDAIPGDEDRIECEVSIQAFTFNVFGCLDNLAHMWVKERNIKRANGKELSPMQIGLGAKSDAVRASLTVKLRRYLNTKRMQRWFGYLEDYRHALAHRIPLYIPPHSVSKVNTPAYRDLEAKMQEALHRGDIAEYDRLDAEQIKLAYFKPVIMHAWSEKKDSMYFHAQMLADYETVVDMGWRMLSELQRRRPRKNPLP